MQSACPARLLVFALASLALVAAAFAFSAGERPGGADSPPSAGLGGELISPLPSDGDERTLRNAAHRFLAAFLRFEVEDTGPQLRSALRGMVSEPFAAQLLSRAPRLRASQAPARLRRLSVIFLTARKAVISGSALRPDGVEQFSFLFELRSGRWRAVGPAE